jgi:hypothetical protein
MVKLLSANLQYKIRLLHAQGLGRNAIARELHVTPKIVTLYTNMTEIKTRREWIKKAGRPRIITASVKRKARKFMQETRIRTAAELTTKIGVKCCKQTSQNLMRSLKAKRSTIKIRPFLSDSTKSKRLTFAEEHISDATKWLKTVFSDEKKFSLTGPDSYRTEWILPDSPPQIIERKRDGLGGHRLRLQMPYPLL